jgi:hypothetical protein
MELTRRIKQVLKKNKTELIIIFLSFLFSAWLMFSTFSYENGSMLIASKAWSDFASHIPLIRSFSFGNNFLPQYPLFSGPPIKYHFLFYALVGLLEKFGMQINYALNIPSALGFFLLIIIIYFFAKEIFKSKMVGALSVLFFIFNSSLVFLKFFNLHSFSNHTLSDIVSNQKFISFGPYDQGIISAFWNLNIYTNQRHLALSYALSLFLIFLVLKFKDKDNNNNLKKSLIIGLVLGLSFLLNMAVFVMTLSVLTCILLLFPKKRIYLLILIILGGIIALPQYLYVQSGGSFFKPFINPGYLVTNLNIYNFINYWWQNLGLNFIFIPLGFIIAARQEKKILISFLSLFIIGNLFQFSPEIAANHKFFNYFVIVGAMFSAYFLNFLWKKHNFFKPLTVIFIFFMIFSGIIDFFPISNDHKIILSDYPANKDISWIIKYTKPNSVFLNTQYLYDNASLAGRKIFLGWPYFSWSQGYDTLQRDNIRKALLNTNDKIFFCKNIFEYNLTYIELSPNTQDAIINTAFFDKNFLKIYENPSTKFSIYDLKLGCHK